MNGRFGRMKGPPWLSNGVERASGAECRRPPGNARAAEHHGLTPVPNPDPEPSAMPFPATEPTPSAPRPGAQGGPTPPGVQAAAVTVWREGTVRPADDHLAQEVPVGLVFNGIAQAVMLASPADLEDFAHGFAWTEGLLDDLGALRSVDVVPGAQGIELHVTVSAAVEWRLRERRRTLEGRTGCGLCGAESLAQVRRVRPALAGAAPADLRLQPRAVLAALADLPAHQAVQRLTGATHAAAWCSADGTVRLVREDVGRHNALDKLLGAMWRAGMPRHDGFVCITSRVSFEIVQKCLVAGVPALAAVSAPTALAVEMAQDGGVLLMGFARGSTLVAYAQADRLTSSG